MIWYVPLEPLQERYTAQMYKWVLDGFRRKGLDGKYAVIAGDPLTDSITTGEVLDAAGTNYYKAGQLMKISRAFNDGHVSNGDIFFIADLWFPGIEMIRYMASQMNIEVSIAGIHYAGVFDPWDFTRKMKWWAQYSEIGWLTIADHVFFGSQFHSDMVANGMSQISSFAVGRIATFHITGLVWDADDIRSAVTEKRKRVIFPHRLDIEKDPEEFFAIAKVLRKRDPAIEFVITSSRKEYASNIPDLEIPDFIDVKFGLTKQQYYDELAGSRVFVSCALQETFGYALNEAIALGCIPICPDELSYSEVLENDKRLLYSHRWEAVDKICIALQESYDVKSYTMKYSKNVDKMIDIMMGVVSD